MKRVYVKEEVCIGCHLCEVYCQVQHAPTQDIVKAFKKVETRPLSRLRVEERDSVSFSVRCQQCDEAPCISACLTGAITRDSFTGMITVDEERCIGCWTCILTCPFAAIKQDTEHKKTIRCDLCQGKDVPACVANCPNEALVFVDIDSNPHEECKVKRFSEYRH